jgi:hypothetical protein
MSQLKFGLHGDSRPLMSQHYHERGPGYSECAQATWQGGMVSPGHMCVRHAFVL